MRLRIAIDDSAWRRACEYAAATHRTPAQLIVEALEQIQARYPKRPRTDAEDLDVLAYKVAALLGLRVQAGTLGGKPQTTREGK